MTLRLEIGCRAVTLKFWRSDDSGGMAGSVLALVSKTARQPCTKLAATDVTVQSLDPTYRRLLEVIAMTWCRPLGITPEPAFVTANVPASTFCRVPCAIPAGVPATKRVEPLSNPTVAPVTAPGAVGPATGVSATGCAPGGGAKLTELKSTSITPAPLAAPPHSAPQLKMKAFVSLPLKTPVKGRSRPVAVKATELKLAVSTTVKVVGVSSLKTSSLVPLGDITRRVAEPSKVAVTVPFMLPVVVSNASTTLLFRTAAQA